MAHSKRKRGAPLGGERLLPVQGGGRGDPLEALRFAAQLQFLEALAEYCPHVLDSLWKLFSPPYEFAMSPEEDRKRIEEWMLLYRLRVITRSERPDLLRCKLCTTWVEHAARITTGEWFPNRERPERLVFFFGQNYFSPSGPVEKPHYYREAVLAGKLDEERAMLPGTRTASLPRTWTINLPIFEPFEDRVAEWKRRCREKVDAAIAAHLADRDPGGPRTPKMIEPDHFKWAALFVCGENEDGTFGWTFTRIRRLAGRSSASTVHRAVRNILNLIGIDVERPRGRRRGTTERRPRQVARP